MDSSHGHWMAGLIDGEGCFTIRKGTRVNCYCEFALGLRLDDRAVLDELVAATGLGKVRHHRKTVGTDFAEWRVVSKPDCSALSHLLEEFPLRAKKRLDYEVWKRAVDVWMTIKPSFGSSNLAAWNTMSALALELKSVRMYGTDNRTTEGPPGEGLCDSKSSGISDPG